MNSNIQSHTKVLKPYNNKSRWILQGEMKLGTYLGIWPVFKTIQIDIKSNHISYSNTIIFPSTTLEHKNWSWFISCFCFNQWIFSHMLMKISSIMTSEWITSPGFEKGGFGFWFIKNPGNWVGFGFSKNVNKYVFF